jgi:hypothetical protein
VPYLLFAIAVAGFVGGDRVVEIVLLDLVVPPPRRDFGAGKARALAPIEILAIAAAEGARRVGKAAALLRAGARPILRGPGEVGRPSVAAASCARRDNYYAPSA